MAAALILWTCPAMSLSGFQAPGLKLILWIVLLARSSSIFRTLRMAPGCCPPILTVCFTREYAPLGLCLLNPATGATLTLPACLSEELARDPQMKDCSTKAMPCAFGQVSSTGEYKLLRVTRLGDEPHRQLCEVITVDGTNHGRRRKTQSPTSSIGSSDEIRWVVVDGVVYFLLIFLPLSVIRG